jgi:hypothetical protein
VVGSSARIIACAGALVTGLLLGGAATAAAEPGDTAAGGSGAETASTAGSVADAVEGNSEGGGGGGDGPPKDDDGPTSTVGNGRDGEAENKPPPADDVKDEEKPRDDVGPPAPKKQPVYIPMLRWPTPEEVAAYGWIDPRLYVTALDVGPSIDQFFTAFSQPEPEPAPGPAFRTQLKEAPVIDSTPGGGDGGIEPVGVVGGEPPVLEAPLVVAPPALLPGVVARVAPLGVSGSGGPSVNAGTPTAAGVRTPLIRGSLPPSAGPPPSSLTPMSGQATRVGYPRYLRNPTVGELAAVALPGVGGLMFLTFSGGVVGYRQANSTRFLRTGAAARFLP